MIFRMIIRIIPSKNDYVGPILRTYWDDLPPLSNIIHLSQIHTPSHGTAFEACAAQLLRVKRLGFRFLDVTSGECTPPFPRRRGQRGDGGVQWPEAFNVRRESLPPLSLPLSSTLRERQKKRGRAWSSPTSMGMNEAGALRRAAPYFSRSQAALMRRIASTMFSSLVA